MPGLPATGWRQWVPGLSGLLWGGVVAAPLLAMQPLLAPLFGAAGLEMGLVAGLVAAAWLLLGASLLAQDRLYQRQLHQAVVAARLQDDLMAMAAASRGPAAPVAG